MAVRKRKSQANYIKVAETFELMGVGFTELNESPSAQTTSKRYINQASASQSITGYEWTTSFSTDMIVSEKAIKFIKDIGELQKTGADCEADYLIVDLDEESTTEGSVRARKIRVAVSVDSFEDNDGEMAISGSLLGVSDIVEGTFNVSEKSFTEGFTPKVG